MSFSPRAVLAALIIGPALALAPVAAHAADPLPTAQPATTVAPPSAAAAAKLAAQNDADMAALHKSRLAAGEVSDADDDPSVEPSSQANQRVPYDNFYAPYECNPHRNYASDWGGFCFNGDNFRSQTMWAWSWASGHPKKADRNPVPFPGLGDGGGGKLAMLPHTVYVVTYSGNNVFKYGITSIPHYQTRANVGRSNCNAWAKKHNLRQDCVRTWVAVVPATFGWDNARFMEASLIKDYQRKGFNGSLCPPGQPKSCK